MLTRRFTVQLSTVLLCLCAPLSALASTAANTLITNEVNISWQNASGSTTRTDSASVSLKVNLVPALPTIALAVESTTLETTEDTVVELLYTVTATANGPDTYQIAIDNVERNNMVDDAQIENGTPQTITLGATTLALDAKNGDSFITVPLDAANDSGSNTSINGISEGMTLLIGANTYQVGAIDKASTIDESANTARIPLTSSIEGDTVPMGSIVGEQQQIALSVRTDFISESHNKGQHIVALALTSEADGNINGTGGESTQATLNVSQPLLSINKYARNTTSPNFNKGAPSYTVNGTDYYVNDVSGNPGDVIEYLVVIDNTHEDSSTATNIIVKDTIPPFTTLKTDSIYLSENASANSGVNFGDSLDPASNGDAARVTNNRIYVYAGSGGTDNEADPATEGGGELEQGKFSFVRFQLEIQ